MNLGTIPRKLVASTAIPGFAIEILTELGIHAILLVAAAPHNATCADG